MQVPAGAISMFGPGTNSLLAESLKKRHPSTSEESEEVSNFSLCISLTSLIFHASDFNFLFISC